MEGAHEKKRMAVIVRPFFYFVKILSVFPFSLSGSFLAVPSCRFIYYSSFLLL